MPTPLPYRTACELILTLHRGHVPPTSPIWSAELVQAWQITCQVHGVASYLQPAVTQAEWLPASLRAWTQTQYQANQQRIRRMQGELQALLALFAAHNVAVMPLKGSILTTTTYPDAALRPMADLDILVQAADIDRAQALLRQLGYEPTSHNWKHTEFCRPDNRVVVDKHCEHPDNPRKVELHSHCRENFGGPNLDLTALMWHEAHLGELLGQPAWLPSTRALTLHLLMHASYHFWQGRGRMIQLLDLEQLYRHDPIAFEQPDQLLAALRQIDPRFTYPCLLLWHKYYPSAVNYALMISQRARVSPQIHQWADGLDLIDSSHLSTQRKPLYLLKSWQFSEGRRHEIIPMLRYLFLSRVERILDDYPTLARPHLTWLAYLLLPLDFARTFITTYLLSAVKFVWWRG